VRGMPEKPETDDAVEAVVEADESEKTMSLMSGVARPEGLPEVSDTEFGGSGGGRKALSQGTMVLIALLAVAALVVFTLRTTQRNVGGDTKEVDAKIEQALAKIANPKSLASDDPLAPGNTAKLFRDTDSIVAELANDPASKEVPIDYVKKNPFVMPTFASADQGTPGADAPRVDDSAVTRKLQAELKNLKLQSVMGGNRPVAIIDGELVQPGGTVGSFKLKAIKGLTVELEASGQVFALTMEDPKKGK
jgi:hypothetical protein